MFRRGSKFVFVSTFAAFAGLTGCVRRDAVAPAPAAEFAALQERGLEAMGVDQYTSTHVFDALADGGRIELQRDVDDSAGVAQIRGHLQEIARAFQDGDFSTPAFVHMQDVPGTGVMAERRDAVTYAFRELPRGGELRIVTRDSQALEAVHAFLAFQRQDHRAAGSEHEHPARGATEPGSGAGGKHHEHGPHGRTGRHPDGHTAPGAGHGRPHDSTHGGRPGTGE